MTKFAFFKINKNGFKQRNQNKAVIQNDWKTKNRVWVHLDSFSGAASHIDIVMSNAFYFSNNLTFLL